MRSKILILIVGVLFIGFNQLSAQFDDDPFNENAFNFDETLMNVRGILVESNEQQSAVMGRESKKLDEGLQKFMKTPFMKKYQEIKLEAESLAGTFKALAQKFDPQEVGRVRKAYNKIATKFNLQLQEIKNDFMDKKKLKLIRQHPEMYSNSLQYKLRELKDEYSQDFERVVAEITGSQSYAAIPLGAILGLIKLSIDFTNFLASANFASRQHKSDHLDRFLIEPFKFRPWDEVPTGEGDVYNQDDNDGFNDDTYYPETDEGEYVEPEEGYVEEVETETVKSDTTTYGKSRIKKMNPFEEEKSKKSNKKSKKGNN